MPLTPLLLVLLAALIHASWNLIAKKSGGDARFAVLTCLTLAVVWAPLGAFMAWRDAGAYGTLQWALIVASGVLHIVYYLCLLRGYRLGDLSVVYPLARGTGPLITALVATSFMGESLRALGWFGVAGIVGGTLLIAGGPALLSRLRAQTDSVSEQARLRAGLAYGVLTGVFIGAYSLLDGYAVKHAAVSPILLDYLGNLARLPLLLGLMLLTQREAVMSLPAYWRQMWKPALLVGAISPVSYVMVLYAATMAPLSQVAPARELSMLFAALLGGHLLGERDAPIRLLGASFIALGVLLLTQS
ncbi:EamA family transporter [Uliginosibacterium aquaticum]|uniref:EamA family transporter n=1 Tax=Uliginosibacterium aquaticum TaxID=2731212 RepID=A0ABX2IGC7_9RHOO|nr:EamA family transporter [Uliginosibacterium aquaticum]NSL55831.1 EamA family transporter [Uliginosibacterium aquaticum]